MLIQKDAHEVIIVGAKGSSASVDRALLSSDIRCLIASMWAATG
jgi:hypothetical protein